MSTLIIGIETVGEQFSNFDSVTQAALLRYAKRTAKSEAEYAVLQANLIERLGFSPLTGEIVALGLYDLERERGVVYYTGPEARVQDRVEGLFTYKARTEKLLLAEFWEGAQYYQTFVTFNGRQFDAPFLFHRSAIHGIRPTKNLLEGRFPNQQKTVRHVDLQDELTFFGAMNRRPSLHLFCRAYDIKSPKGEVGVDDMVKLYRSGEFLHIAKYNAEMVIATTELYKKWLKMSLYGETEEENIDF